MQCIGKQSLGNGLHGPILGLLGAKKENSIMDFFEEENMWIVGTWGIWKWASEMTKKTQRHIILMFLLLLDFLGWLWGHKLFRSLKTESKVLWWMRESLILFFITALLLPNTWLWSQRRMLWLEYEEPLHVTFTGNHAKGCLLLVTCTDLIVFIALCHIKGLLNSWSLTYVEK